MTLSDELAGLALQLRACWRQGQPPSLEETRIAAGMIAIYCLDAHALEQAAAPACPRVDLAALNEHGIDPLELIAEAAGEDHFPATRRQLAAEAAEAAAAAEAEIAAGEAEIAAAEDRLAARDRLAAGAAGKRPQAEIIPLRRGPAG